MQAIRYGNHGADEPDDFFDEPNVRLETTFRPLGAFQTPTRRPDGIEAGSASGAGSASRSQASPTAPVPPVPQAFVASQAPKVPPAPLAPMLTEQDVPGAPQPPEQRVPGAVPAKVLKRPSSKSASEASGSQECDASANKAKKVKSAAKTSETPGTEDDGGTKEEAKEDDGQADEGKRGKGKAKAKAAGAQAKSSGGANERGTATKPKESAARSAKPSEQVADGPAKATSSQTKRPLKESPPEEGGLEGKRKQARVAPTNKVAPESAAAVHARQGASEKGGALPQTLQQARDQSPFWSSDHNINTLNVLMSLEGLDVLHGLSLWAGVQRGQKSITIKAAGVTSATTPRISVMPGP